MAMGHIAVSGRDDGFASTSLNGIKGGTTVADNSAYDEVTYRH